MNDYNALSILERERRRVFWLGVLSIFFAAGLLLFYGRAILTTMYEDVCYQDGKIVHYYFGGAVNRLDVFIEADGDWLIHWHDRVEQGKFQGKCVHRFGPGDIKPIYDFADMVVDIEYE